MAPALTRRAGLARYAAESIARPSTAAHGWALFLTSTMLLYTAIVVLDPSRIGWGTGNILPLKYGGVILSVAAIFFFAVGGIKRSVLGNPAFIAIVLFGLYQIIGSLFAMTLKDVELQDTFLGRGLTEFTAVLGMLVASRSDLLARLSTTTKYSARIYGFFGLGLMLLFENALIFSGLEQALHIEMFLIAAGAIWISEANRRKLLKYILAIAMIFIAVESGKATAYLLLLMFFFIVFMARGIRGEKRGKTYLSWPRLLFVMFAIPVFLLFSWNVILTHGAVNERDLRFVLWEARIDQFLSSPLYGSFFFGSPLLPRPNLPDVGVPTHNDFLDILAEGGLAGIFLLAIVLWTALKSPLLWTAIMGDRSKLTFEHFYAFLFLAWGVAALGNPVFAAPSMAVPVWFSIGVLCARAPLPRKQSKRIIKRDRAASGERPRYVLN